MVAERVIFVRSSSQLLEGIKIRIRILYVKCRCFLEFIIPICVSYKNHTLFVINRQPPGQFSVLPVFRIMKISSINPAFVSPHPQTSTVFPRRLIISGTTVEPRHRFIGFAIIPVRSRGPWPVRATFNSLRTRNKTFLLTPKSIFALNLKKTSTYPGRRESPKSNCLVGEVLVLSSQATFVHLIRVAATFIYI